MPTGKPKNRGRPKTYEQTISEKAFQAHVIQSARLNGFRVSREDPLQPPLDLIYHTYSSKRSVPGFPDLCLVRPAKIDEEGETIRPGRLILSELKSEKGRVRDEQKLWLKALKTIGPPVEVYIWRPSQMQEITAILGGRDSSLFL